jgi:hypothetical protein
LLAHAGDVYALCLRGTTLVSGGLDGKVRVWDTETGRCVQNLVGHKVRESLAHACAPPSMVLTAMCALPGLGHLPGHGRRPHLQRLHGPHHPQYACVMHTDRSMTWANVAGRGTLPSLEARIGRAGECAKPYQPYPHALSPPRAHRCGHVRHSPQPVGYA